MMNKTCASLIDEMVSLRKARRVSQRQLAAMTGHNQVSIARIETKKTPPTLETFCNIIDALDAQIVIHPNSSSRPIVNTTVQLWVNNLATGKWDIGIALQKIFEYMACGIDYKARFPNGKPFVDFAKRHSHCCYSVQVDTSLSKYILCQLDSICTKMEQSIDRNSPRYLDAVDLRDVYTVQSRDYGGVAYDYYYTTILKNWDIVGNYSRTYSFLAQIAQTQDGWNTPESGKIELIDVIQATCSEWD